MAEPFDPDKYLAEKTGSAFDPDAYLATKSKSSPSKAEKPVAQAGPTPSFWERLKSGAERSLYSAGDAIEEGADAFGGFMSGLNKKVSMGAIPAIQRAIGVDTGEEMAKRHPTASALGESTGLGLSAVAGPEALIAKGVGTLTNAAAQRVPALASNFWGRIGSNAATGAGTAALSEAGHATGEENVPMSQLPERMVSAAKTGALFSGGMSAAAEGAGAARSAIVGSRGGQARELIEKHGGDVGALTPGSGGPFDVELAGLPVNDRGIGQASRKSAAHILNDMEERFFSDVATPHSQARAAIASSPAGQAKQDVTPIYSELVGLYQSERLTPGERGLVEGVLKRLDGKIGEEGGQVGIWLSNNELNDFRGMLQDLSKTGSPANPTVAQSKMQKVAHSTKEAVDQGPYADTNKRFHEGKSAFEENRQLLDLPAKPSSSLDPARAAPEGGREPEVAKLANMMARDQQNTVTAGVRNSDRLSSFAEKNPEYARDLELPEVLRAKADLQFRLGGKDHGGLIDRLPTGASVPAAGLAYLFTQNPKYAAAPLAAEFVARNAPAITGRMLYTPAQEAARLGAAGAELAPRLSPLFARLKAAAEEEERRRKQQP